mgnify:FL=1
MGLSIVLVAVGIGTGWAIYGRQPRESASAQDPLASKAPGLFAALANRLGCDEFYAATLGRLSDALASFSDVMDRVFWSGVVRLTARIGEFAGWVNRDTDENVINGGFDQTSGGLRKTAHAYSHAQTGDAHGYLRGLAIGFVIVALALMLGGIRQ